MRWQNRPVFRAGKLISSMAAGITLSTCISICANSALRAGLADANTNSVMCAWPEKRFSIFGAVGHARCETPPGHVAAALDDEGSKVFQNSTSQAMVRVISTAWCWASGESAIIRSNDPSAKSSKFLGECPRINANFCHYLNHETIGLF